jgi:hypothetical protein
MTKEGKWERTMVFFVTLTKVRVQLRRPQAGFRLSPE